MNAPQGRPLRMVTPEPPPGHFRPPQDITGAETGHCSPPARPAQPKTGHMKPLSERARALGWHLARAALFITGLAFTVAYGAVIIIATATALAGYGPWWIPAGMVAALTIPIGAATWWWAGMERP